MRTPATARQGYRGARSGRARADAPMSGRVPVAAWILISALVLGACGCTASNPPRPASLRLFLPGVRGATYAAVPA